MGKMRQTTRGYEFFECASAMQKAIRRGDATTGGYFAVELFESGFGQYVWKRLLTVSAEDCWGLLTQEVEALYSAYTLVNEKKTREGKDRGRIFIAKAVILMAAAKKSRDADHLTNFVYDQKADLTDEGIAAALAECRGDPPMEVPDYAFDVHTKKGKRRGMTREDFFRDEHQALAPRQPGLFDHLVPGPSTTGPTNKPPEGF